MLMCRGQKIHFHTKPDRAVNSLSADRRSSDRLSEADVWLDVFLCVHHVKLTLESSHFISSCCLQRVIQTGRRDWLCRHHAGACDVITGVVSYRLHS